MFKEFRAFLMRGNLIELAVAFVLATFFAAVVDALVAGIVLPLVAALFGEPNFYSLTLAVGDGVLTYGSFLTAVLNFVIVAWVLFLILKAYNRAQRPDAADAPSTRDCSYCFSAIPVRATRCSACTSEVQPAA